MIMEKSWSGVLAEEFKKPYLSDLKKFLDSERKQFEVFPSEDEVFEAFRYTPYDEVKLVILGQDPYHGPGQAHGLSFSVKEGIKPPPSLKNIFKELEQDVGAKAGGSGYLGNWAKQGVLLLNATLTVRRGEPLSHHGKGWEKLTDAVVKKLSERSDPLVFMLWGKSAQEKCKTVLQGSHLILTAAHPSPYSVKNFLGCRHFSKANELLINMKKKPIDWGL